MWSGSVIVIPPSFYTPTFNNAKFFNSSQPIAPAPTTNTFASLILLYADYSMHNSTGLLYYF